jgi:hypothetical protein
VSNPTSKDEMREALEDVCLWLRSALECKQWVWDSDQRLAAMGCLATADELLKSPVETKAPLPPGFVLMAVCAGCEVRDDPGVRHHGDCPAYPGKPVRP